MEKRNIDTVTIATFRDLVEIPWESRQELVARLRELESCASIVREFEDVGASSPVKLTAEQKDDLRGVVRFWLEEVGSDELPAGIWELRNALVD